MWTRGSPIVSTMFLSISVSSPLDDEAHLLARLAAPGRAPGGPSSGRCLSGTMRRDMPSSCSSRVILLSWLTLRPRDWAWQDRTVSSWRSMDVGDDQLADHVDEGVQAISAHSDGGFDGFRPLLLEGCRRGRLRHSWRSGLLLVAGPSGSVKRLTRSSKDSGGGGSAPAGAICEVTTIALRRSAASRARSAYPPSKRSWPLRARLRGPRHDGPASGGRPGRGSRPHP